MASTQQLLAASEDIQLSPNQVLSEQQSLIAIKKLLAIAVSGITYLRGIFPGKAYASRNVGDQQVMILREERSCPGAIQMLQWVQGCFEAIQKKYLRTVIISIFTDQDKPQKVTELYQFRIQYTPNGAQMHFESNNNNKLSSMSCGNTKKASILLVRKLYTLMQNLGPLPEDVCMSMKLAYYDDITPLDYQPLGFKEADGDTVEFEQEPVKLTMGEVVTPFHCLKLDMATERHRLDPVEETIHVKEKWVLKMEEGVLTESHVSEDMEKPDNQSADLDKPEIQLNHEEKMETCEKVTAMDTLVKNNSDMEVGLKRTRSGRIIRSTTENNLTMNKKTMRSKMGKMVSQYEISSSQETPSSTATKKRKFSEPKERH